MINLYLVLTDVVLMTTAPASAKGWIQRLVGLHSALDAHGQCITTCANMPVVKLQESSN